MDESEGSVSAFAVGILSLFGVAQAGTSSTQHLPTTLERAGENEIIFKSQFSAKKGTLITTFKFLDLQHTAPQLQHHESRISGLELNSFSIFPSVFPNLNHRYECCRYKFLPCWCFT